MIQPELRKEAFFISIFLIWPGARDDAFLSSSVAAEPSVVIGLLDYVWCCRAIDSLPVASSVSHAGISSAYRRCSSSQAKKSLRRARN
jgi:hypothetical protein